MQSRRVGFFALALMAVVVLSACTKPADRTPDQFAFASVTNAEPGDEVTSNAVIISGINASTTARVSGAGELVIGGTPSGVEAQVTAGTELAVRVTSSEEFGGVVTAAVDIGGVTAEFSVTTRPAGVVPDTFEFSTVAGAELNTTVISNEVVVSGTEVAVEASVTGDGNPELFINGESAGQSGPVEAGDVLRVSLTTGNAFGVTHVANVDVGGTTAQFEVTTRTAATDPDAFEFPSVLNAELGSTITSDQVEITGIEAAVAASVGGEGSPVLVVNDEAVGTTTTVAPGDTVRVSLTTGSSFEQTLVATATIGTATADFAVTTRTAVEPVVVLTADLPVLEVSPNTEVTLSWVVTGDYDTLTLTTEPPTTTQVVTGTSAVVTVPGNAPATEYILTATHALHDLVGSGSTGGINVPLWVCENPDDVITLADAGLLQRFYELPSVPNSGEITCAHAQSIYYWDTEDWEEEPGDVSSLVGMQHFSNLTWFTAHWNEISDLTPLAGLGSLQELNLDKNRITDLSPLANHPSLRILELWDNGPVRDSGSDGIADLSPLATIPTLEQLFLSENNISELGPLADLTSLTLIYAIGNQITDIAPLANLTDLRVLRLNANMIADGSVLAGLENLGWVELEYNLLTDEAIEPFEDFEDLWVVRLEGNYFTDLSVFVDNLDFPAASGVPGLPDHRLQPTNPIISFAYNCIADPDPVVTALEAKSAELEVLSGIMRDQDACDLVLDGAGFGAVDAFGTLQRQLEVLEMYREQGRIR